MLKKKKKKISSNSWPSACYTFLSRRLFFHSDLLFPFFVSFLSMIKQLLQIPDESGFWTHLYVELTLQNTSDTCNWSTHTHTHTHTHHLSWHLFTLMLVPLHLGSGSEVSTLPPHTSLRTHSHTCTLRRNLALLFEKPSDFICLTGGKGMEPGREMPTHKRNGSEAPEHLEMLGGDQGNS